MGGFLSYQCGLEDYRMCGLFDFSAAFFGWRGSFFFFVIAFFSFVPVALI